MKKSVSLLTAMVLLLSVSAPVMALEIVVSPYGVVEISGDEQVLGVRSDKASPGADNRVYPSENKSVRVVPRKGNVAVTVVDALDQKGKERSQPEVRETKQLNVKFPAGQSAAAQKKAQDLQMSLLEQETASDAADRIKSLVEDQKQYMEQIRQERRERVQEMAELRNRLEADGSQGLELTAASVSARLKPGALFELDPETNMVYLTTPSGNQHMLEHLPDQAIERMFASQDLRNADEDNIEDLEVEVDDEGNITYRTKVKKVKKFLGLFPREVETEVVLKDNTGEVEVIEEEPQTLVDSILNALSF